MFLDTNVSSDLNASQVGLGRLIRKKTLFAWERVLLWSYTCVRGWSRVGGSGEVKGKGRGYGICMMSKRKGRSDVERHKNLSLNGSERR